MSPSPLGRTEGPNSPPERRSPILSGSPEITLTSAAGPEYREWPAVIQVAPSDQESEVAARSVLFLEGSFELQKGHGLDGYMVFEVPAGTEFRDMRWRAGDSITIRF